MLTLLSLSPHFFLNFSSIYPTSHSSHLSSYVTGISPPSPTHFFPSPVPNFFLSALNSGLSSFFSTFSVVFYTHVFLIILNFHVLSSSSLCPFFCYFQLVSINRLVKFGFFSYSTNLPCWEAFFVFFFTPVSTSPINRSYRRVDPTA